MEPSEESPQPPRSDPKTRAERIAEAAGVVGLGSTILATVGLLADALEITATPPTVLLFVASAVTLLACCIIHLIHLWGPERSPRPIRGTLTFAGALAALAVTTWLPSAQHVAVPCSRDQLVCLAPERAQRIDEPSDPSVELTLTADSACAGDGLQAVGTAPRTAGGTTVWLVLEISANPALDFPNRTYISKGPVTAGQAFAVELPARRDRVGLERQAALYTADPGTEGELAANYEIDLGGGPAQRTTRFDAPGVTRVAESEALVQDC